MGLALNIAETPNTGLYPTGGGWLADDQTCRVSVNGGFHLYEKNRCVKHNRKLFFFFQELIDISVIYICEFCLKYMKSQKCLERHLVSVVRVVVVMVFLDHQATTNTWWSISIALCRDPSTRHLERQKWIWTGRNMVDGLWTGKKMKEQKKVFQNHSYF